MRLHVVGLPHTDVNPEYTACAYTQKHLKFCNMMYDLGHEVFSYAGEHSTCRAKEHYVITSDADKKRWFGEFDFHSDFFPDIWNPADLHWSESNAKAIEYISRIIEPGDIICIIAGWCHKPIADYFSNNPTVEYGIGYQGTFSNFRVYESYSHMHQNYGSNDRTDNGRYYDAVIPNYFDPDDFTIGEKEDYHVFLGRFIRRKGIETAVEATRRLGVKLIMAGQGCRQEDNLFVGDEISLRGEHVTHIGHVGVDERKELLSKAKVCWMPTTYLEPFGGVSVEALLSGTPVIASDFGAFTEIVKHGKNGYRFRTLGEAVHFGSPEMIAQLEWSPEEIRQDAIDRFGLENVAKKYEDYFLQVYNLFNGQDWYSEWHGRDDRYNYP